MSAIEIVAILAMTAWAVYKQTQISEIRRQGRFKMAVIYGIIAVCVGGFALPSGTGAWALLAASLLLSFIIGAARGRLTRIWVESTGKVMRQGTALTIGLFLALILAKFVLGVIGYVDHVQDGAGFGEIMAMIAIMMAVQAEIVWRRGRAIMVTNPAGASVVDPPNPAAPQVEQP